MLSLWPVEQWLPYAIVEKPSRSVLCLQAVDGIAMHMPAGATCLLMLSLLKGCASHVIMCKPSTAKVALRVWQPVAADTK